jgi:hypothetical protein
MAADYKEYVLLQGYPVTGATPGEQRIVTQGYAHVFGTTLYVTTDTSYGDSVTLGGTDDSASKAGGKA